VRPPPRRGELHAKFDQLGRREFITLLGGAAAAWPLAARAQQPVRITKIGHIESGIPSSSPNLLAAFRQGLRELGYVEGQNLFIERRYGEGREERRQACDFLAVLRGLCGPERAFTRLAYRP
jgi:hypothetical protein